MKNVILNSSNYCEYFISKEDIIYIKDIKSHNMKDDATQISQWLRINNVEDLIVAYPYNSNLCLKNNLKYEKVVAVSNEPNISIALVTSYIASGKIKFINKNYEKQIKITSLDLKFSKILLDIYFANKIITFKQKDLI